MTASDDRWIKPAQHRHITLGNLKLSYVPDGFVELEPKAWYETTEFDDEPPVNDGGFLVGSVGSIVVHEPDGLVVIDAGLGPLRVPAAMTHFSLGRMMGGINPDYAEQLSQPIKAVVVTHAHEDHVGWLRHRSDDGPDLRTQVLLTGAADASRLARLIGHNSIGSLRGGEQIGDSVRAIATPGHTAGHMAYLVESQGQRALVFGDVFHNPLQILNHTLRPWSDEIPAAASHSRGLVAEILQDPQTVGVGYHFADVVFGHSTSAGWVPTLA